MRKLFIAISTLALAATAAVAEPIADRKALMKANGAAAGALAAIVKGEKAYDMNTVMEALAKLDSNAKMLDPATLFPAGSDKGDTAASPKIWEDPAGFQAKIDAFRKAAADGVAAHPQDAEGVKAVLGPIGAACGGCHESFRIKKT